MITVGTDTQLSSEVQSGYAISAVSLSNNKVFIAHSNESYRFLYGMICTINESVITIEADIILSSATTKYTGVVISAVQLSENKIFIAHSLDSGSTGQYRLYGIVCTISRNNYN